MIFTNNNNKIIMELEKKYNEIEKNSDYIINNPKEYFLTILNLSAYYKKINLSDESFYIMKKEYKNIKNKIINNKELLSKNYTLVVSFFKNYMEYVYLENRQINKSKLYKDLMILINYNKNKSLLNQEEIELDLSYSIMYFVINEAKNNNEIIEKIFDLSRINLEYFNNNLLIENTLNQEENFILLVIKYNIKILDYTILINKNNNNKKYEIKMFINIKNFIMDNLIKDNFIIMENFELLYKFLVKELMFYKEINYYNYYIDSLTLLENIYYENSKEIKENQYLKNELYLYLHEISMYNININEKNSLETTIKDINEINKNIQNQELLYKYNNLEENIIKYLHLSNVT